MLFIRRLGLVGAVVMLVAVLSGCAIRPLWWDGHGGHEHEHFDARFERQLR